MARLLNESRSVAIGRVAAIVLSTATAVIVARAAGTEGRGLLSLVTATPQVLVLLISLGLPSANVFMVQRHGADVEKVLGNGLVVFLGAACVAAVTLYFARYQLPHSALRGATPAGIVVLAAALLPVFFHRLAISVFHATRRISTLMLQEVLFHAARFAATAIFVITMDPMLGMPLGLLTSAAVVGVIDIAAMKRGGVGRPRFDRSLLQASVKFGVKSQASDVLDGLQARLDLFVVSFFCGVSQLGLYSTSRSMSEFILFPCLALTLPLYPRLVGMEPPAAAHLAAQVARSLFWVSLVLGLVLVAASREIIELLFGSQFLAAQTPLFILVAGTIPLSICRVVNAYLMARGKPGWVAYLTIAGFVTSIVLAFLLIPRHGPTGAAVASGVASVLVSTVAVLVFARETGESPAVLLLPQRGDADRARGLVRYLRQSWRPAP